MVAPIIKNIMWRKITIQMKELVYDAIYKGLILTSSLIICSRRLKMCKDIKKKVKDVVMHDTKTLTRHTLDFDRSHLRQSFHTNCIEPLGNDIFSFQALESQGIYVNSKIYINIRKMSSWK